MIIHNLKRAICFILFLNSFNLLLCQNASVDTTIAGYYYRRAKDMLVNREFNKMDSILFLSEKAATIYEKNKDWEGLLNSLCNQIEISVRNYTEQKTFLLFDSINNFSQRKFGKENLHLATALRYLGFHFYLTGQSDEALEYNLKGLEIRKKILGERSLFVADSYNLIGIIYMGMFDYDKALENLTKSLDIRKEKSGENNIDVALSYYNIGRIYSLKNEFDKALEFHFKSLEIRKQLYGEKSVDVSSSYASIGSVYHNNSEYDKAIEYYLISLSIQKDLFGENNTSVAESYVNLGRVYYDKAEYDISLEHYFKSLSIRKELLGEKNIPVSESYNFIGIVYRDKAEYDKALEYYFKSLEIRKEVLGENSAFVSESYNNIGMVFDDRNEYDRALEYYLKSLTISKDLFGDTNMYSAIYYNNIGTVYQEKGEYGKSLENYLKSLEIRKEVFGDKNPSVATSYINIGSVCFDMSEYDKGLEYSFKGLDLLKELFGDNRPDVALSYSNIGMFYSRKGQYDKALEYEFKGLAIREKLYGDKHSEITMSFDNLGQIYSLLRNYPKAIYYFHNGIAASVSGVTDTSDIYNVPRIENYLNWKYLLEAINAKAEILANYPESISQTYPIKSLQLIALQHYLASDTLILKVRKSIITQSDKITLGEKASDVYKGAIQVCEKLIKSSKTQKDIRKYSELSFYFSEQNKSMVLLESLAGTQGLKFAGVPDSLLQKEHNIKTGIHLLEKKIAENSDSITAIELRENLFAINRRYEELITSFEKNYPEYYNLKYSAKNPSVNDIQKSLDDKTAIRSYFVGDSILTIYTITKKNLRVSQVPLIKNLNDSILWFRYGLTMSSPKMKEYYRRLGFTLYKNLFPNPDEPGKQIRNIIIIPDGNLAKIPFETLLTENYSGNTDEYKSYPFLINKYNISYSYSTNLFYRTFSDEKPGKSEKSSLKDWLAFAPVFDTGNGMVLSTRELQNELRSMKTDSLMRSGSIIDRDYISSLPATETETRSILKIYDDNNLRSRILLYDDANEQCIKSGILQDYKIIHFATHGFVNSERPDLSGIILARDTTSVEDGILFSGEIYNLNLNADLVVLSACETGLGKIHKGEGIIGLTRAFLYSGVRSLIVSLWQVADASTSDLMVYFYRSSVENKNSKSYSEALRSAKLKMISDGKYAHPLFWSPFILIGE